ncbi:MAG: hypothetical protein WB823_00390 [Steroidobacteraceae bacterium]
MSKGWVLASGLIVGVLLGILTPKYVQRAWANYVDRDCEPVKTVRISPDGATRAILTTKGCDYGFGFAASFATVRIERRDPNGWYMVEPLSVDPSGANPKVTITWKSNSFLEADIESTEFSGSLQQDTDGFTFVQRYAPPARETH